MSAGAVLGPPWDLPAALQPDDALPAACDVLVRGGSLAGLAAAAFLAEGGARVALLASGPLGGFSLRSPGLLLPDLGEHPHRLVSSVGLDEARAMLAFLSENRALLAERALLRATGSWVVAAMPGEAEELEANPQAPAQLGLEAQAHTAEQVREALGAEVLGSGRFLPAGAVVDPVAVALDLVERARAAGARLGRASQDPAPQADAEVLADGWRLAALDPWFADKLYAVRHQWIATAPLPGGRLPAPVSAQHGFSHWLQRDDGRIVAGGARFGTPHLEIGETDDGVVQPRIDHILRSNLGRFFPDLAAVAVTHAWTGIATHTCDGLPFLGPLPGRPTLLACVGLGGLDHRLALRAGQAVAQGLLTGRSPAIPRLFGAGRMV